jgi:hypothetical protein
MVTGTSNGRLVRETSCITLVISPRRSGESFFSRGRAKCLKVVWLRGREVPRADIRLLEENVTANRAELLEEWERKVLPQ